MSVRVLVVDDSATMRGLISATLSRDPAITVVGAAADPLEARQAIKALNPDVVTLEVEMPNMNGLDFLDRIMRLRPMPVIMVSSLTQKGAQATLQALELGAVDCVVQVGGGRNAGLRAACGEGQGSGVCQGAAACPGVDPGGPAGPGGRLRPGRPGARDRRLYRRRGGTDRLAAALPRQLPADRDHPAHAARGSPAASPSG